MASARATGGTEAKVVGAVREQRLAALVRRLLSVRALLDCQGETVIPRNGKRVPTPGASAPAGIAGTLLALPRLRHDRATKRRREEETRWPLSSFFLRARAGRARAMHW